MKRGNRPKKRYLKTFESDPEIRILEGRWGPYISYKKENYKIKKGTDINKLTLEDCRKVSLRQKEQNLPDLRRKVKKR